VHRSLAEQIYLMALLSECALRDFHSSVYTVSSTLLKLFEFFL
jgi:hypothetical protein